MAKGFGIACNDHTAIRSTVFEDNEGAIHLAKRPDLMPRMRHLSTKHHHFKENLGVDENGNGISIKWIPTTLQIADIFTEGVGPLKCQPLRDSLMGWAANLQPGETNCDIRKGELKILDLLPQSDTAETGRTSEGRPVTQLLCKGEKVKIASSAHKLTPSQRFEKRQTRMETAKTNQRHM